MSDERVCSKCKNEPARVGQRWCAAATTPTGALRQARHVNGAVNAARASGAGHDWERAAG